MATQPSGAAPDNGDDPKLRELTALVEEIRERVRSRRPGDAADTGVQLANLMPLSHARDAAEGKVAWIGRVNPRRGGPVNAAIQAVKKTIARGLGWFVRDQVEFNREIVRSLNATLAALGETNRALSQIAAEAGPRRLNEWRREWEAKISNAEIQFLRGVAELQAAFQHRAGQIEALARSQHGDFETALDESARKTQAIVWEELARLRNEFVKVRGEYESLIHHELRTVRQRASLDVSASPPPGVTAGAAPSAAPVAIDWLKFAEKFRGSESYVRECQTIYVERLGGRRDVLDIGCGRGEFLELMREAGSPARGIEGSAELAALCRAKGLDVVQADAFAHLAALPPGSLDGILCSQMLEHLEPAGVPRFIGLCERALRPGGMLAVETPNPECLAIFATHFFLDPSHTRPIPPALMAFYFEEAGLGAIEVQRLRPAADSAPSLKELPASVREAFFGSLDYVVFGTKL